MIDNICTNLQLYWNSKKIKTKQEEILRRKAILEDRLEYYSKKNAIRIIV